jgi:hypothetical protein
MSKQHDIQIGKLDKKITELRNALANLAKAPELTELQRLIHQPPWTTIAEVAFTLTIIESLIAQANTVGKTQAALLKAGKQVGGE